MPSDDNGPVSAARRRLMAFVTAELNELDAMSANEFLEYAVAELQLLKAEIETGVAEDDAVQLIEDLDENGTDLHEVEPISIEEARRIRRAENVLRLARETGSQCSTES